MYVAFYIVSYVLESSRKAATYNKSVWPLHVAYSTLE